MSLRRSRSQLSVMTMRKIGELALCAWCVIATAQARDPFYDQFPSCEQVIATLEENLNSCYWVGTIRDHRDPQQPILHCHDRSYLVPLNTPFLTGVIEVIESDHLQGRFPLPSYCKRDYLYTFYPDEG